MVVNFPFRFGIAQTLTSRLFLCNWPVDFWPNQRYPVFINEGDIYESILFAQICTQSSGSDQASICRIAHPTVHPVSPQTREHQAASHCFGPFVWAGCGWLRLAVVLCRESGCPEKAAFLNESLWQTSWLSDCRLWNCLKYPYIYENVYSCWFSCNK